MAVVCSQMQSSIFADTLDCSQLAVGNLEVVHWRSELDAVPLGKRAQLLAVNGHTPLPAWIKSALGAVL